MKSLLTSTKGRCQSLSLHSVQYIPRTSGFVNRQCCTVIKQGKAPYLELLQKLCKTLLSFDKKKNFSLFIKKRHIEVFL